MLGSLDCTPGYYNNEGEDFTAADRRDVAAYPQGPAAYFDFIENWRDSGDFDGLDFR